MSWSNQLYFGDNLEVLRDKIADESVDLIYLDPPFNSKANYNVLYKEVDGTPSTAQFHAFTDFWEWNEAAARTYHELATSGDAPVELVNLLQGFEQFLGHNAMLAYLVMMAPRLVELRRVLKPAGSIYLHCDPTASHYLKLLMDAVFSVKNYRNEILWKRTSSHNDPKRWGKVHDTLLFYSKAEDFKWNVIYQTYDKDYIEQNYRNHDERGRYKSDDLTGAGITKGDSGKPWRDVNPTAKGRHWGIPEETVENLVGKERASNMTTQEKLDLLDKHGFIYWPKRGSVPRFKHYLDETKGVPIQDVITDISPIGAHARERLGYPTQKPQALLERILKASSNPGDVVLDPFCGCGTTIAAAQALDRKWIGIDITYLAINLIESRLADHFGDDAVYEVHGIPEDWKSACALAEQTDTPRKEFELWALSLVKARPKGDPSRKGGGDKGIDGVKFFIDGKERKPHKVIIQVKSDKKPKPAYVRDLRGVMEREQAAMGALILLHEPSSRSEIPAEAASAGFYHSEIMGKDYPKVQVLSIKGLLNGIERLQIPQWAPDDVTFKRAERIEKPSKQKKLDV